MNGSIYIIEDEYLVRWTLEKELTREGYSVETFESGEKGLERIEAELPDVILLDLGLPQMDGMEVLKKVKGMNNGQVEIIIITAKEDIKTAVRTIKSGAYDYVTKPLELDSLKQLIKKSIETMHLKREVNEIRKFQKRMYGAENIIGQSKEMQKVFGMAKKIAKSKATTVLLSGESGTGKELIAKFIHYHSERSNMPFTEINCSAVPDTLLETELMGYEKGAFTDAKKRKLGLLEQCNGGTLFLDEIGDMKLDLQTKILSLIENKRFRRVGGIKDMETDVRIIAATNRDLSSAVKDGYFREDLYYRLKVFPITLPPLRERTGDISLLIKYFVDYFNKEFKKNIRGISIEAKKYLKNYCWPGNCRELKNVIERAMILEEGDYITPEHLPKEIIESTENDRGNGKLSIKIPPMGLVLEDVEIQILKQALDSTNGNQVRTAKLLGISRDTLRYRMKKFGFLKSGQN